MKVSSQIAVASCLMVASTIIEAYECTGLPVWNPSTVYLGGDQVQSQANAFRANWWTRDQDPVSHSGAWQEWTELGPCDRPDGQTNLAPVAAINGSYAGVAGQPVSFSSSGSNDPDGRIVTYQWHFGDGSSSNDENPTHLFTVAGQYAIRLTVFDDAGSSGSAEISLAVKQDETVGDACTLPAYRQGASYSTGERVWNVGHVYQCEVAGWCGSSAVWAYEPGVGLYWQEAWSDRGYCDIGPVEENQPPIAVAAGPDSGHVAQDLAFSGLGSSDPDGHIERYRWSFGDGDTSDRPDPTHSYSESGNYAVTLTVTDDAGASASMSLRVAVIGEDRQQDSKLVGYFVEWGVYGRDYHVKDIVDSGSAEHLTHIVYAFGNVKDGACAVGDPYAAYDRFYRAEESVDGIADTWDQGALRGNFGQLRRLKERYPGIKILWSFGGWTWSEGFQQAAANPEHFAESCFALVYDNRWPDLFDGIDIDWEYPNACGLSCDSSGFSAYRDLMRALRERFGENRLVTAAIGAGEEKLLAADYGGAAEYLDFYMPMTYDFFGAWASQGPTAPHSPLLGYQEIPTEGLYADNAIQLLLSQGVPSDKILLGIGFYGRGWRGVQQSEPGGLATGPALGTFERGIEDYKKLKIDCPATGTVAGTAYAHCGANWWSYDTPETIRGKMDYARQNGLAGAFFWELSGDTEDGELVRALDEGAN